MGTNLIQAREAFEARRWDAAYRSLTAADRALAADGSGGLDPDDLWLLSLAAYLTGRDAEYLSALERAHHAWLAADDLVGAARAAFWLGFYLAEQGEIGPATGWMGRASRLLEQAGGDRVEAGYLLVAGAHQRLEEGDAEGASETASRALSLADRFGDRDLAALAVHVQGRSRLEQGRLEEGLALLDESMVGVAADEVSPLVAGLIYCSVIGACRRVYALDRARAWTTALRDWCQAQPDLVPYRGQCLVYRSEILQLHGQWGEALAEAKAVQAVGDRGVAGAAHYQRGEVHRVRGELEAAEAAYRAAAELGREPQPGLALLRLAQGDVASAAAGVRRVLAETQDGPRRARLLPACVEISLAAGDLEQARAARDELAAIASSYGTRVLDIMAAQARGAVALAEGDALAALVALRRAADGWRSLDAPYEAARVRILLARACAELGDEDSAALERDGARAVLERLGAGGGAKAGWGWGSGTGSGSGSGAGRGSGADHGLTSRELEVLALVATGRTNRAIGEALFISERTVDRHVSNILAKLGLSSRSAATAYAYEHELV
jgi:ATP/maltotriose-dependent transcriptional regulator MalT